MLLQIEINTLFEATRVATPCNNTRYAKPQIIAFHRLAAPFPTIVLRLLRQQNTIANKGQPYILYTDNTVTIESCCQEDALYPRGCVAAAT